MSALAMPSSFGASPANKNIANFLLGWPGNVWELARLWAPDGHAKNLLTQAISAAVALICKLESPDALVSYADPNAGHKGGVYRAASWLYSGRSKRFAAIEIFTVIPLPDVHSIPGARV